MASGQNWRVGNEPTTAHEIKIFRGRKWWAAFGCRHDKAGWKREHRRYLLNVQSELGPKWLRTFPSVVRNYFELIPHHTAMEPQYGGIMSFT